MAVSGKGMPDKFQAIVEERLNEAGLAQRSDLAGLEQSYRGTMSKSGIAFHDVDADSFRAKLKSAGYYTDVRRRFGDRPSTSWRKRPARLSGEPPYRLDTSDDVELMPLRRGGPPRASCRAAARSPLEAGRSSCLYWAGRGRDVVEHRAGDARRVR